MSRVNWAEQGGEEIEHAVAMLLYRKHPRAVHFRPSVGDGGIDVLLPEGNDKYTVFQVKKYTSNLTSGQKKKTEASFGTLLKYAEEKHMKVTRWVLVLPLNPTKENHAWMTGFTNETKIEADWVGRTNLDSLAAEFPEVIDFYFEGGKERVAKEVLALTNLLAFDRRIERADENAPLQPTDVIQNLTETHKLLNAHDPHFRYDLIVSGHQPNTPPEYLLLADVQRRIESTWVTVRIFARCEGSTSERAVPAFATIRAQPGTELHASLREFHKFGALLDVPLGNADMSFDLPGGLGGDHKGVGIRIIPYTLPENQRFSRRLQIINPDGQVLAEVILGFYELTSGPSQQGIRSVAKDASGILNFTFLSDFEESKMTWRIVVESFEGHRLKDVIPVVEWLQHCKPGNFIRLAFPYGPVDDTTTRPITDELNLAHEYENLDFLIRALSEVQEHTREEIKIPLQEEITPSSMRAIEMTQRLLRGESLVLKFESMDFQVHDNVDSLTGEAQSFEFQEPLMLRINAKDLYLGTVNIRLESVKADLSTVRRVDDMDVVTLVPADSDRQIFTLASNKPEGLESRQ